MSEKLQASYIARFTVLNQVPNDVSGGLRDVFFYFIST